MFNTNRIPGEHMDELVRYPGNTHIIVIRCATRDVTLPHCNYPAD